MGKRILFITHQLSRTGAPIVLIDMIKLCVHRGFHADVISMMDGELRVELEEMGLAPQIIDRFFPERQRFIKEWAHYDLVVANTLITYEAVHILNGSDIPVLWWLHEGVQYFQYFKSVIPDFNELGENVHPYAVSPYVKAVVKDIYGCDIPMLHFAVDGYNGNSEEHYKERADKIRFLTAGTFSKIKGQDVLVQAIKMLPAEYIGKTEFSFCGNEACVDEDVYGSVCRLADEYDNVNMLHQLTRQETIKQMELADCLIVPSRVEPLPTVAIEMMMTGGVVMCTNVCGISYYIEDGKNGLVVDADNPYALAENIMKITDERNQLEQMGKESRITYESHFSREAVEPDMLGVIEGLIGKSEHKRIILFVGVYDTLDIFSYELEKSFCKMGYETYIYDVRETRKSLGGMAKFLKQPVDAVITFNNLGFNMELDPGKNIWDELRIPCINILMDHPFCYKKALDSSPQNAVVLCTDRNHMKYIQRFYSNIAVTGFLPHAGKIINDGADIKKIKERNTDVMYAGNLSKSFADNIMPDWSKYTEFDAKEVCRMVYEDVIANPYKTTEQGIEESLNRLGVKCNEEELCQIIADLHFVDLYIVSYYREKVVEAVAKAGIELSLYGAGWDICDWINMPNVHYFGKISADDVVVKMRDAKIVLSTMTWFKDGTHDRVFNGMLQGAVTVTDESIYMREEFNDSELIMFKLNDIDYMVNRIKTVLSNPDDAQAIADNGYAKALTKHSWEVRARELDEELIGHL